MATIDNTQMHRHGVTYSSNEEFVLARTTCCQAWVVEEREYGTLFYDAGDLSRRLSLLDASEYSACPLCANADWDFEAVSRWPQQSTGWEWAYHAPGRPLVG